MGYGRKTWGHEGLPRERGLIVVAEEEGGGQGAYVAMMFTRGDNLKYFRSGNKKKKAHKNKFSYFCWYYHFQCSELTVC